MMREDTVVSKFIDLFGTQETKLRESAPQPRVAKPAPRPPMPPQQKVPTQVVVPQHRGQIFAVFGCKGGAGATTIAVNLASSLARSTRRGAAVLDLDVQLGDVLTAMNLEPQSTMAEVASEIDALDAASLRRRLALHRSGAYALAQAGRLEQLDGLRADRIPPLVAGMAGHFDAIVVDGLRDFGDMALGALDMATTIVMVVTEDVPAVRGAARCLDIFRRLGYPDGKYALVVNRHRKNAPLQPDAIAQALHLPVFATVSNDFEIVERAVNDGSPLAELAPRARVTRDLDSLANALIAGTSVTPPVQDAKVGIFARVFGKQRGAKR